MRFSLPDSRQIIPAVAMSADGIEERTVVLAVAAGVLVTLARPTAWPLAAPFVLLWDPDDIKELFTAPPDAVHPGEGARVLEPLIGRNSVISTPVSARSFFRHQQLMGARTDNPAAAVELPRRDVGAATAR